MLHQCQLFFPAFFLNETQLHLRGMVALALILGASSPPRLRGIELGLISRPRETQAQ
jgi:hypothetical protein